MIRPLSRFAALCLAATLLVSAVEAQQAPASPPRAPAAAPPAAPPAAPAPSHLAAAKELTSMTGVLGIFDGLLPSLTAQIRQSLLTRPEVTKDLDQVLAGLKPEIEQQKQIMIDATARYYTTAFTEAELKELIAMFKTPVGQRYLRDTPRILDTVAVETERWTGRVSELLMTRVRAEMAKRGHQL